jgi:carbamoyl-phosphate synthase large subunit
MRVMFVGGGRRVSLAKRFIAAGFDVFAYEIDKSAPIGLVATIIPGKRWDDPSMQEDLLCRLHELSIDVAIPLQDAATVVLSRIAKEAKIGGTSIPTASEHSNNLCLDKKEFEKALIGKHFYPSITDDCEKVILKPIRGFASKGIKVVNRADVGKIDNGMVAQRFIEGGYEISVDAYFNKQSQMIDAVPRVRLETSGGEVSRSITLCRGDYGVEDITRQVGEEFKLVGPLCVQYIMGEGLPYIMEINARFGGGVILSLEAGFDIVDLIKKEYVENIACESMKYRWKENFGMIRYFSESFYEE